MSVYRAIAIPLDSVDCDVKRLMALTNLAYRGFIVKVPELPATTFHELKSWVYRDAFSLAVRQSGGSPRLGTPCWCKGACVAR